MATTSSVRSPLVLPINPLTRLRPSCSRMSQDDRDRRHAGSAHRGGQSARPVLPDWLTADPHLFGRESVAVRRLANPVTLCDGHGVFFVAASGQIRMAASPPGRA